MHHKEVENHIARFVENHVPPGFSFIVGVSGGVDSTALLHLLHDSRATANRSCHVVHVDHGWREESAAEACIVEQRVRALGLPFVCYRLDPCPTGENAEDWCRRQRMSCFLKTASEIGTDIVFLAHQADDQAEVVFKRFLEGASLTKFRGMRAVERKDSLTILRPLLGIKRSTLLEYLHYRSLPFLLDPTNHDTSYLRPRLRDVVFPFLRDSFGKEFDNTLLRIAHESEDLDRFVHDECEKRFSIHKTPNGVFAMAVGEAPPPPFLVRYLVDQIKESLCLPAFSRHQVESAVSIFCGEPSGGRHYFVGGGCLLAERGFFAAFAEKPVPIEKVDICEERGERIVGRWHIRWQPAIKEHSEGCDWKQLFSYGSVTYQIPNLPFTICKTTDTLLRTIDGFSFKPPFCVCLRPFVPAIEQAFRLVADPISGYTVFLPSGNPCLTVTIQKT